MEPQYVGHSSEAKSLMVITDDTETSFDTMVSSSNHIIDEIVTVKTDRPIVWTAELRRQDG
jgi:thiamine pyrophosphokinase